MNKIKLSMEQEKELITALGKNFVSTLNVRQKEAWLKVLGDKKKNPEEYEKYEWEL